VITITFCQQQPSIRYFVKQAILATSVSEARCIEFEAGEQNKILTTHRCKLAEDKHAHICKHLACVLATQSVRLQSLLGQLPLAGHHPAIISRNWVSDAVPNPCLPRNAIFTALLKVMQQCCTHSSKNNHPKHRF